MKKILIKGEPHLVFQDEVFENTYTKLLPGMQIKSIGDVGSKSSGSRCDVFKTFVTYLGTLTVEDTTFLVFELPTNLVIGLESGCRIAKLYIVQSNFLTVPDYDCSTARFYQEIFQKTSCEN